MLIYRRTSVMTSNAQTLVNTVNCVGVMGKGVAAEFKSRFPEMFDRYKEICDRGALAPGKLWLWRGEPQWVLNFPTKIHWRNPSKLEWIDAGLAKFVDEYEKRGITEISFPRLGCGNGGLNWDDVRLLMERYLSKLPINVYVHDHSVDIGIPEHLERATGSCQGLSNGSFEEFQHDVERLVGKVGERLVDIETHRAFRAEVRNHELVFHSEDQTSLLGPDDLRGVWLALLSGLLTQDKVGWSKGEDATRLFSLLCLLPCVRPIQIQRANEQPELALELVSRAGSEVASFMDEQYEMAWA